MRDEVVQVRITEEEAARWREEAEADGRSLSAWVRQRCNAVVDSVRPPREIYVRASRPTANGAMVEPGVEYRDGDRFDDIAHHLQAIMFDADPGYSEHDPVRIAAPVEEAIKRRWPDRAYFVEVHDPQVGWVQIFQPFGVPRNR